MKKKRISKSRYAVRIGAEQVEYLRYYSKLTGQRIADILRDMIAQRVAVEYATRIPTLEQTEKIAKKRGKKRLTTKKS
jgi:predicted DNA-binding protein